LHATQELCGRELEMPSIGISTCAAGGLGFLEEGLRERKEEERGTEKERQREREKKFMMGSL
jgi:hypothetical protein